MNLCAIPEDKASEGLQFVFLSFHCHNEPQWKYLYRQQVLDGNLVPKVPQYMKEGLLEYIVKLIVSEDEASAIWIILYSCLIVGHFQAFQIVDKEPFRRLLKYLRPNMPDKDIPHRTKIKDSITHHAEKDF
jgi:hypothetical protein